VGQGKRERRKPARGKEASRKEGNMQGFVGITKDATSHCR